MHIYDSSPSACVCLRVCFPRLDLAASVIKVSGECERLAETQRERARVDFFSPTSRRSFIMCHSLCGAYDRIFDSCALQHTSHAENADMTSCNALERAIRTSQIVRAGLVPVPGEHAVSKPRARVWSCMCSQYSFRININYNA